MKLASSKDGSLIFQYKGEYLQISPWGKDSLRIRSRYTRAFNNTVFSALLAKKKTAARIRIGKDVASITNGMIRAEVRLAVAERNNSKDEYVGQLTFFNEKTNSILLKDYQYYPVFYKGGRVLERVDGDLHSIRQEFESDKHEKLFGLGQHLNNAFDQKGCVIDLVQKNRDITIPFVVSSRGYGFLWNNPGVGRFTSSVERTRWESTGAYQLDYWITCAETPAQILNNYFENTGRPSEFPQWATGFWQCKLRYEHQDEILAVVRKYKELGIPISVIVSDYFHWTYQGDWKFDPKEYPNPVAMMDELKKNDVKLMVSVWPSVVARSENYEHMKANNFLVTGKKGENFLFRFYEKDVSGQVYVHFYDATNEDASDFVWSKVRKNYLKLGIDVYWLDACEPEMEPAHPEDLMFSMGPGSAVANVYPLSNGKKFYEKMKENGIKLPLNLCRSAWAGSQRYGMAVWSGDVPSSFGSLRRNIKAGLNMAMSGIPWWTTDIGGFYGGHLDDPEFGELVIRWFQYCAFLPILRLHGARQVSGGENMMRTGADNEIWSYGKKSFEIFKKYILLREKFRPYIKAQLDACAKTEAAFVRPLLYDFPNDTAAWEIDDQYMFGSDYMVAPVDAYRQVKRNVYFPKGERWTCAWTGKTFAAGTTAEVSAPIDIIPVFVRGGAKNLIRK